MMHIRDFFRGACMALPLASVLAAATPAHADPQPAPSAPPLYKGMHWRSVGPGAMAGRVTAVTGSRHNAKLYYAGAAGGGVWKSVDGGHSWSSVFEAQSVGAIGAIAMDPANDDVVYVGTGEANPRNDVSYGDGVYKTVDGGKTWTKIGLEATRHIARILVDPLDGNHVIVGALGDVFKDSTERGVFVSRDGGRTWKKTLYLSAASGASDLALDPRHPNVVYAGMWHFRRYGWTFESGGDDDGLFKSTDGGNTWNRLTGHGLPDGQTGRIGLAVAPSDGSHVYALIEAKGGTLWRSTDAGQNWTMATNDTLVDQRPFYFSHLEVDPANPDKLTTISMQLARSEDGGKTFHSFADQLHSDHHSLWIAPDDPDRMILGGDGGQMITNDGGRHWFASRNMAIGQIYHVGYSLHENPYTLCIGLQDNNSWCGPSNSLDPSGNQNKNWTVVNYGDGEWAVPDPLNPNFIWSDSQNGFLAVYDKVKQDTWLAPPYVSGGLESFDARKAPYRFNWSSPIAFAPWDSHVGWIGGNVVFQTTDRGRHWKPISPDLTKNIKEHQAPSGGPITNDVSGAESTDSILDIEGSQLVKGEMWIGTDDGLIKYSPDFGKRWIDVTPTVMPEFGHVETVAPSPVARGTVFASVDNHLAGDYRPYIFVTHDYGKHWTLSTSGLPQDQYARTVRPDIRNPNLVFAGTENGMWASFDAGQTWNDFRNDMPPVSVRDIRIQPEFDDLIVATHGRGLYIMDHIRPLQDAPAVSDVRLFPVRDAYEYSVHLNDEGHYSDYAAGDPAYGATIAYYLKSAASAPPSIEILDGHGAAVRTIRGTHDVGGKQVPYVPNKPGLNRYVWDFNVDGPTKWHGAASETFAGPDTGPGVVPGRYTVRLTVDGKTFLQPVVVKPDPRSAVTQAEYVEGFRFAMDLMHEIDGIDRALNDLDDTAKSLHQLSSQAKDPAIVTQIQALTSTRDDLFAKLTANFKNPEDLIQRPGAVREDVASFYGFQGPMTQSLLDYGTRVKEHYRDVIAQYNAFAKSVAQLNGMVAKAGLKTIAQPHVLQL